MNLNIGEKYSYIEIENMIGVAKIYNATVIPNTRPFNGNLNEDGVVTVCYKYMYTSKGYRQPVSGFASGHEMTYFFSKYKIKKLIR